VLSLRWIVVFWAFGVSQGLAQTISDVELQAGYCLGVSTTQLNSPFTNNAISKQMHVPEMVEERQRRFKDYLAAKGFMTDRSPEPLAVAMAHGRSDVNTCESENEKPYVQECRDKCVATLLRSLNVEQNTNCMKRCPEPRACKRVKKCLENFLPF
jgi:hypothetical protein